MTKSLLHFLPSAFYGGPEKQILQTAVELRSRYGYESRFVVLGKRGVEIDRNEFVERLRAERFDVEDYARLSLGVLRVRMRASPPDAILTYGYKADILAVAGGLAGGTKIPRIAVIHGWTAADWKVRAYERVDRWVLKKFYARIVVISDSQVELLDRLGFDPERVTGIPNAIDVKTMPKPRTAAEVRAALGLPTNVRLVLGTVGRLSFEKGHADLIRAMPAVLKEVPDAHLVVVGEGPERATLDALVTGLGLERNVTFTGFQKDGGRWIGGFDLFVLPSHREALPLVLMEAFAYGTPMVGTAVGDVARMVKPGVTGWLASPRDIEGFAGAIVNACRREDQRRSCADHARRLLEAEYSIGAQAERWHRLLERDDALAPFQRR